MELTYDHTHKLPPNGAIIDLVIVKDHIGNRMVSSNYDDYTVSFQAETIGMIRRMFGGTENEYTFILFPLGGKSMYDGISGVKKACDKLVNIHSKGAAFSSFW